MTENKRKNLTEICQLFEQIAELQKNKAIMAVRCSGDYEISKYYMRFKTRPNVWCDLSDKSQKTRISNFLSSKCHEIEEDLNQNITKIYKPTSLNKKEANKKKEKSN